MIALLLAASLGQTCVNGSCRKQVAIVQQQVVAQQVYAVQPLYAPQFVYAVGEQEQLKALTAIAENQVELQKQQALILEQNAQIVARLQAQPIQPSTESKLTIAARGILQRDCVSCHKPGNTKGDIDLTGILSPSEKLLIAEVADTGSMPPAPAKALSDEDAETLRAWAVEDRAAVRAALSAAAKKRPERVGGP